MGMGHPYSGVYIDDGLSLSAAKARYQSRRQWLKQAVGHPMLLVGPRQGPLAEWPWAHAHLPVFQDPYVLYLTGINQCPCALFLDPNEAEDVVMLPPVSAQRVFWDGIRLGAGDGVVGDLTGLKALSPRRFQQHIHQVMGDRCLGVTRMGEAMKWPLMNTLKRRGPWVHIDDTMWAQRLVMDTVDLHNLSVAIDKTKRVFEGVMATWSSRQSEDEVYAQLMGGIYHESSFGPSFHCIVGAEKNATVLHYSKHNDPFPQSGLVLLDFGVRWQAMHADISRVLPIGGRFSGPERELYGLVRETAQVAARLVRPGVSLQEVNEVAWSYLAQGLSSLAGVSVSTVYDRQPHQIGHLLGHQVHDGDEGRAYRHRPLVPGMVLTIEPGFYGQLTGMGWQQWVGIRLEDNYVVTDTGAQCLSADIPIDPGLIELALR